MIDLRSDTVTKPSPAMRAAIAGADVGDDQKREDPSVADLERRVAGMLGHESAVFVPSATMANQIALRILSEPGDEVLADRYSHIFLYELGGPAVHGGLVMKPIEGSDGTFSGEQLDAAFVSPVWYRSASTVLCIENTHAESGGRVWDPAELSRTVEHARTLGLRVHLDGARLLNASVSSGADARVLAAQFDTVTLCLTKGLGCPVGALLAGGNSAIEKARRLRMLFGGAMRQAGVLAAAGLYALDHNVQRLADDHRNAQLLARLLRGAGLDLWGGRVDSNMVLVDIRSLGLGTADAIQRLELAGVRLSSITRPGVLRAVTHLDVSEDEVHDAARRIVEVLVSMPSGPRPTPERRT